MGKLILESPTFLIELELGLNISSDISLLIKSMGSGPRLSTFETQSSICHVDDRGYLSVPQFTIPKKWT